ncbi:VWA domain-containing protein [Streptomyces sviceus]|uniref:VWA domain-containing protein n=1 Tax=Streptomyces sviceus TaxID=285530 RepID=UPI0036C1D9A1
MGILTLLRNAFGGRSRKGAATEAEGAETTPSQETEPKLPSPTATVPEPRTSTHPTDSEHELVAAAFDKVAVVPKQTPPAEEPNPTAPREKTTPETAVAEEPTPAPAAPVAEEPVAETPVAEEPAAVAETPVTEVPAAETSVSEEPRVAEEPVAEEAAVAAAEEKPSAATEVAAESEPEPAPDPVVEAVEPEPEAEPKAEPEAETAPEPKPEATVAPEPEPEAEPKAEPEAETAPEPEPEATVAPEPETEPKAEPEAETAPEPKPEATVAPEPETEPKAEPEAETAPEPKPEPQPEPEAAEVTPEPEPEPTIAPAPEPAPESVAVKEDKAAPEPEPVAAVAPTSEPAPDVAAVDDENGNDDDPAEGRSVTVPPTLRTAYDAAATTLDTHGLTGTTARTYLVLDRSASMRPYYKDGSAQALGEQTLALAAHLDPESKVHVVFFSTELDGTGELGLTDHENKIDELHAGLGRMGRTSYHAAVEEVLAHHTKNSPDTPALVVFQTDGAPDAKTPATQALTEAAKTHPNVFFSFVAFGDPENKAFDYLRKLKLANTSHFLAGETPKELTDAEIYEGILANWRP